MARVDEHGERTVTVTNEFDKIVEKFKFNIVGMRSIKGMIQGLWSLNPFSAGLSGRNGFSDVDAHTEIDGRSLVLEFKQSLYVMNKGQVMKAIRQAKFQKTCTWFIEGETDKPTKIIQINETGLEGKVVISQVFDTNMESLIERIGRWEEWARNHSLVKGNKTEEWNQVNEVISRCRKPQP
jgi:hypothetical protein